MSGGGDLSLGRRAAECLARQGLEDEALPMLPFFRDVPAAMVWCRDRLAATAGLVPEALRSVQVLRHRPGRRCTLRLEFDEGTIRRVYVKLFRPGRSRAVVRRMSRLPGTFPVGLLWARTLLHLEREGLVLLHEVPGESLEAVISEGCDPALVGGRVGAAIAQFHALAGSHHDEMRTWTAQDEMATLSRFHPRLLGPAAGPPRSVQRLLERARQFLDKASFSSPVLLHRDLHPQQILIGESVGLVDLDNLATGPPEIDLGNLIAHFDLFALHRGHGLEAVEIWRSSVLASYLVRRPLDLAALQAVRAATLVRLAGVYAGADHLPSLTSRLLAQAERFLVREVAA